MELITVLGREEMGEHGMGGGGFTKDTAEDIIIIIILAGMAVFFNVAGYLIEERLRWPIINASPRGQSSK